MTPVLIPDTFITPKTSRLPCRLFGPTTILQPSRSLLSDSMKDLAEQGRIHLSYADTVDEDTLSNRIAYFREIGLLRDPDTLRRLKYLKNESDHHYYRFPANLRTRIDRLIDDEKETPKENPLLAACLFLSVAQLFDEQQAQLTEGFRLNQRMEARMVRDLLGQKTAGDNRPDDIPDVSPDMNPAYPAASPKMDLMIKERLTAWKTLYRAMPPIKAPCLITANRAVWDVISNDIKVEDTVKIETINPDDTAETRKVHQKVNEKVCPAFHVLDKLQNRSCNVLHMPLDSGLSDGIWVFSPRLIFGRDG